MHRDAYVDIEECYSTNENPSDDRVSVKLITRAEIEVEATMKFFFFFPIVF